MIAKHRGPFDPWGTRGMAQDQAGRRSLDPGDQHRPVERELTGQVEVVERDAGDGILVGRRRAAVVEHQGDQEVGSG